MPQCATTTYVNTTICSPTLVTNYVVVIVRTTITIIVITIITTTTPTKLQQVVTTIHFAPTIITWRLTT